jgi:hypothetical protein
MIDWKLPAIFDRPVVVFPLAGVVVAAILLIGTSDRAAAFAGSLFGALAAVIAVLLAGQVQRTNDRAREARDNARRMLRNVRQVEMFAWLAGAGLEGAAGSLTKHFRNNQFLANNDVEEFRKELRSSLLEIPKAVMEFGFDLADDLPSAFIHYSLLREAAMRTITALPIVIYAQRDLATIRTNIADCQRSIARIDEIAKRCTAAMVVDLKM